MEELEKRWAAEAPEISYKWWLAERVLLLEEIILEARDHLYTKQDMDRVRELANKTLPIKKR